MNSVKKCLTGLIAAALLTVGLSAGAQETSVLPGGESSYNLLMIGTDHRSDSWNGNSDVMILTTIDSETEQITMTSFMRDLYADIPGYGVHKLNYAYAAEAERSWKRHWKIITILKLITMQWLILKRWQKLLIFLAVLKWKFWILNAAR